MIIKLSALILGFELVAACFGSTSAGDPPSGTLTASPNVTYIGIGMKMTFSASNLKDKDCKDGQPVDDDAPSIKIKANNGAAPVSSLQNPTEITFPLEKTDVKVSLELDDAGKVFDDGGYAEVSSLIIKVRTPTTVNEESTVETVHPVAGGTCKMAILDEDKAAFTVAGVPIREDITRTRYYVLTFTQLDDPSTPNDESAEDQHYAFVNESGTHSDSIIGSTDSAGKFDDLVSGEGFTSSASAAEIELLVKNPRVIAVKSAYFVFYTQPHKYTAEIGNNPPYLINSFRREWDAGCKKDASGKWVIDNSKFHWQSDSL